jgi:hypothetical protein
MFAKLRKVKFGDRDQRQKGTKRADHQHVLQLFSREDLNILTLFLKHIVQIFRTIFTLISAGTFP